MIMISHKSGHSLRRIGLLLSLMIAVVLLSGCTQTENDFANSSNSSFESTSNISETPNTNVSENMPPQEVVANASTSDKDNSKQSDLDKLISGQIKSDSALLLPTIDDFDYGWELDEDEAKNISDWSSDRQNLLLSRGFIEGHYRQFKKGGSNLAELGKIEYVLFSISLYDKSHMEEIVAEKRAELEEGRYSYNETYLDEEYNESTYQLENVTKTREHNITYSFLKDPKIGDSSLMWSEAEDNDFLGEVKKYHLAFTKKNVWLELTCSSLDTDKSVGNCLKYAKVVEAKI
jgi:hypothetical protein